MQPLALIFFAAFALVLVAMYILVRRRIGSTALVAAGGILGSIIAMMLFTLAQGNTVTWAVLIGLLVGGLFSVGALLIAIFFTSSEARKAKLDPYASPKHSDPM